MCHITAASWLGWLAIFCQVVKLHNPTQTHNPKPYQGSRAQSAETRFCFFQTGYIVVVAAAEQTNPTFDLSLNHKCASMWLYVA